LLPRFWDVQSGGVFIDGVDIRDQVKDLRIWWEMSTRNRILINDTFYQ
jgi:ABC-type transport system involved in Fe-S cluster assembly fused permease/ATPase subunit